MRDPLESLTAGCGNQGCTSQYYQVAWCPAWDCWLCWNCRSRRNENELRMSGKARAAMQAEAASG